MKFSQIIHNGHSGASELCNIGLKYKTDKSPLVGNSHSYTSFYNLLFSNLRYRHISFGEIGIYKNASMKMWREYFPNANLYGWDCLPEENVEERYKVIDFIQSAKNDFLYNTIYDYMNVKDEKSIETSFNKVNTKFDILIDDSDHDFWSQIRIIRESVNYMKPGGILIIEDVVFKMYEYFERICEYGHNKFYDVFTQVKTMHNNQTYGSDCDELIVLIRNGVEQ